MKRHDNFSRSFQINGQKAMHYNSVSITECDFETLWKNRILSHHDANTTIDINQHTSQTASNGSVCKGTHANRDRNNSSSGKETMSLWLTRVTICIDGCVITWLHWDTTDSCATFITAIMDCSLKDNHPFSLDHYERIFVCTFFGIFKPHQTSTTVLMVDLNMHEPFGGQ